MSDLRIGQVAELLSLSVDSVRRLADSSRLATRRTAGGHRVADGADVARLAIELAAGATRRQTNSVRNRFRGIVTRVVRDAVAAQVEVQAGPHRFVAMITREAADALALEPGVLTTVSVKSTNVSVEIET
ncbi:MAG: TOBE domain-containing protein [Candidatus Dormibacteria bacterium]